MRSILLVLACVLMLPVAVQAGAKRPKSIFRVHIQTNGEDLPTTQAMPVVLPDPPMTVYVKNPPAITELDVIEVKSKPAKVGNALKFVLNAHGREKLRSLTVANRGQILVVVLNGRVIYAPVIDRVVENGVIIVPGGVYDEEVKYLKEDVAEILKELRRN